MPDAIITSTASTFGTISGTFAADQSTVTGTVTGIVAGTLSGSVGVPGPAGAGVPAGGTAGQYLQKIDGVDYNTDWVTLNLSGYAPLASPAFTGNPTAPTAALGDNDTSLATTAFVQQELLSGTANAKNLEVYVRNQTGSTLAAGAIVYINGATGNRPTVTLAQANNDANSAQTMGFVKTAIANNGFGYVIVRGECENLDTSAVAEGTQLYLSPTVAGAYTTTKPSAPQHLVYVGIVIRSHPTQGVILVAVQNGYELNELHDVQITSPTNGQVLKYNSTTGLWYNGTDSAGVAWGGITGTLSSQTDLQTALDGKYSTTNPAGYITSSALTGYATETFVTSQGYITSAALSPYLTSATAASTYQTLSGMSSYLTTSAAASTYLTQANAASTYYLQTNPAGYITSSALSPYLTSATAASTYQTLSGMSSYLTTATAASTYATILEPSVDGILTVEPSGSNSATVQVNHDANNYIHLRAGVGQISMVYGGSTKWFFNDTYLQFPGGTQQTVAYPGPSGFLLKADNLSGLANTGTARTNLGLGTMATETASNYLTTATAASTYQTLAGMSSYLTTATAASTYFTIASAANKADLASPVFTGDPQAPTPATSDNDTSIATTAFVKAQGYLTSAPVTSVAGRTGAVTLSTSDISGLGTMATATAADYSTTTVANGLYYPLASNPAGYLTSAPVTSVAGRTGAITLAVADVSGAAPLASPALTGTPTAPTASAGTSTTQLATTAFVTTADNLKANLASPTFTGTPTAPTATAGTNTTQIATTAFVRADNNVKAWVNFNGTGTIAIRASSNVSSITDNGVGDYTVNFTTAMADANYAASTFSGDAAFVVATYQSAFGFYTQTTTAFRFMTVYGQNSKVDASYLLATFIR